MSDIRFGCPECGKHLVVDENGAGRSVHCPHCGETIVVPDISPQADPVIPPDKSSSPGTENCPSCSMEMSTGSVICLECGYDKRSGKKIEQEVNDSPEEDEEPVEPREPLSLRIKAKAKEMAPVIREKGASALSKANEILQPILKPLMATPTPEPDEAKKQDVDPVALESSADDEKQETTHITCPYCGEEILSIAKKCKHCGEWIDKDMAPSVLDKLDKEAFGYGLLFIPVIMSMVMYFWITNMNLDGNPGLALTLLALFTVVSTSILAGADAAKCKAKPENIRFSPSGWAVGSLLLWIIFYPWWLSRRALCGLRNYRRIGILTTIMFVGMIALLDIKISHAFEEAYRSSYSTTSTESYSQAYKTGYQDGSKAGTFSRNNNFSSTYSDRKDQAESRLRVYTLQGKPWGRGTTAFGDYCQGYEDGYSSARW